MLFLDIKNEVPPISIVDRYELAMSQLSQILRTADSDDIQISQETYESTPSQLEKSLQENSSALFLDNIHPLLEFAKSSPEPIISSNCKNLLDILLNALNLFRGDHHCISLTFSFISILSLQKNSLEYFYTNNIFAEALNASHSVDRMVSFEALKVVSVMIDYAFNQGFRIDIHELIRHLDELRLVSRGHEYFVAVILRAILAFSHSSECLPEILDIVCSLLNENAFDETLAAIADMVLVILNNDFNAFPVIHNQYAITSVLFELLDENTTCLEDVFFATPVLHIILLIIKKCDADFAVQTASVISASKYQELMRKSNPSNSYLALKIVSFLLLKGLPAIHAICFAPPFLEFVITKFLIEAPFSKKIVGLLWCQILSEVVDNPDSLFTIVNSDIINICSFGLDSTIASINLYLQLILNLLKKSVFFQTEEVTQKLIQNVIANEVADRAQNTITEFENSCMDKDQEIIKAILQQIEELNRDFLSTIESI